MNQDKKVALITGANKGIGREVARRLSQLGVSVYAGARDEGRGRQAMKELSEQGVDVQFLQLDVTNTDSIKAAANRIAAEVGYLDILVNNAGIVCEAERPSKDRPSSQVKPSNISVEQFRETYEVNVFGVVAVTQAMLPLLLKSGAARIVNLSSPLGSLSLRADGEHFISKVGLIAYGSSKAALNSVTLHYANELREAGILVNAANPGFVATDLNSHSGVRSVEEGARIVIELATLREDGPTGTFRGDEGYVRW